jgi:hypothetical protein
LLIQQALREIVTKIASNPLVKTRYRSSVWPDFIGEMTRVGTNQGVSRQKLARTLTVRKIILGTGDLSGASLFSGLVPLISYQPVLWLVHVFG